MKQNLMAFWEKGVSLVKNFGEETPLEVDEPDCNRLHSFVGCYKNGHLTIQVIEEMTQLSSGFYRSCRVVVEFSGKIVFDFDSEYQHLHTYEPGEWEDAFEAL